ncbi:MAG: alpha/beta hydrolase family protein [bacterium]
MTMSNEYLYGHMVQEYYVERVRRIAEERAAERAAVRTKADVTKLSRSVRRKIRRCFGPRPDETPLNPRTTGTVERDAYTIEKLIFDSRPDFPVTANLYLPKQGEPPFPAVLGTCGHAQAGKGCELYQGFARHLARMGYVVLMYDPISQGERLQYLGIRRSRRPGGLCPDHNMMGNQMHLLGGFFGMWRAWDGIRALDLLLARPEVDRGRVGVTGNSGGGTMTTWLTGLDARFTMAAPSCFVTRYLNNLENEESQDAEQVPPGLLAAGLDQADFYVARIPRPTILLGKANDFFDRRGLEDTYEELRRLYRMAGAEENVQLFLGPGDHGYDVENREAMYRFFNRHAGVDADPTEPRPLKTELPETLQAAPRGQVHYLKPRTVFDFTRDAASELAAEREGLRGAALHRAIVRRLALSRRTGPPRYRVLRTKWVELTKTKRPADNRFPIETEPGMLAMLHAFSEQRLFQLPTGERATVYVPHMSALQEFAKRKTPAADPLFAVDVRGIGMMTALSCDLGDFFAPYDSDYMYATYGQMLGEPYSGRRVHDLLCALDLLESQGYADVHLVGRGLGAVWATFAAVLHDAVTQVTLHNALLSYHELTQTPTYKWPLSAFVFGVLAEFDLPDCLRELAAEKDLTLVKPWDADMRTWRKGDLSGHINATGLADVPLQL